MNRNETRETSKDSTWTISVCAQHHRQRRNDVDEAADRKCRRHQPGCRAALQRRGYPEACQEGFEPVPSA